MGFLLVACLILFASPASAFYYQYNTNTLAVTGGNMDASKLINTVGHAYFEQAGNPTFPAPAGCPTGRAYWSQVNQHPNPTAIVLKADLKIFRCREVSSADDVDAIVNEQSKALCDAFPQPDPLVQQLKLDVDRVCEGDTADSGDCADARAAYTAVVTARARDAAADKAEAKRLTEAIQMLHTDAATFKSEQGW